MSAEFRRRIGCRTCGIVQCAMKSLRCFRCARVAAVRASGLDELHAFLEGTQTAQAVVSAAVVVDREGRTTQTTSGTFAFARPGKFRWTYDKPFEQLIVGDGEKVWIYDHDLNQVIVRKLDAALGATPAALLAGDNALEKNFTLRRGRRGRRPRVRGGDAEGRRLAVQAHSPRLRRRPAAKDAIDGRVRPDDGADVQRPRRNPKLPADTFHFTPPKGADVVGQ